MGANCVASTSIGLIFCCKGCNAEKLRNSFTFVPPSPSYTVTANPEDRSKLQITYTKEMLAKSDAYRRAAKAAEVHFVTTASGNRIPLVWMRTTPLAEGRKNLFGADCKTGRRLVLLHCHGNAADIGLMMGPYFELSKVLGIEVLGVEYSGYGASTGSASSGGTCSDIEAAYDFLLRSGVSADSIVAYGQSVGSGPASFIAARREVAGLILHSAMLSGIKVIDPQPNQTCRPSCVWRCFDFYPNDQHMTRLHSPTLIMHGQKDDIVPFYHGYRLQQAVPKEFRCPAYFPERGGHNDLVETDLRGYFCVLTSFIAQLRAGTAVPLTVADSTRPPSQASMADEPEEDKELDPPQLPGRSVPGAGPALACERSPVERPAEAVTSEGSSFQAETNEGYEGVVGFGCEGPGEMELPNFSVGKELSESTVALVDAVHTAEPRVGPDDRRYNKLRREPRQF